MHHSYLQLWSGEVPWRISADFKLKGPSIWLVSANILIFLHASQCTWQINAQQLQGAELLGGGFAETGWTNKQLKDMLEKRTNLWQKRCREEQIPPFLQELRDYALNLKVNFFIKALSNTCA